MFVNSQNIRRFLVSLLRYSFFLLLECSKSARELMETIPDAMDIRSRPTDRRYLKFSKLKIIFFLLWLLFARINVSSLDFSNHALRCWPLHNSLKEGECFYFLSIIGEVSAREKCSMLLLLFRAPNRHSTDHSIMWAFFDITMTINKPAMRQHSSIRALQAATTINNNFGCRELYLR